MQNIRFFLLRKICIKTKLHKIAFLLHIFERKKLEGVGGQFVVYFLITFLAARVSPKKKLNKRCNKYYIISSTSQIDKIEKRKRNIHCNCIMKIFRKKIMQCFSFFFYINQVEILFCIQSESKPVIRNITDYYVAFCKQANSVLMMSTSHLAQDQ